MVMSLVQWMLVRDADAPVEADEICAATEEHMLAVVDDLADARDADTTMARPPR